MEVRKPSIGSVLVLSVAIGLITAAPATAKRLPKPPPQPPPSTSSTFVRTYADVHNGVKCDMTPEGVQATSDGGSVVLGLSSGPNCQDLSWVVKLDAAGNPQWQKEVGCFGLASGGFSYGTALRQTADGGYVIAGGARDCESNPVCPYLGSVQCGLVEKLDATGNLVWSRVFSASTRTTAVEDIRQTSDGGFVAVGSIFATDSEIGALVWKLDGLGNVQWQRQLGPVGQTSVYFATVEQTADGGFVASGELAPRSACDYGHGCGQGVLVVKLDAGGNVVWQHAFNSFEASGAPTASEHALAAIQSSDGGYLVAGNWRNTTGPGTCCRGALLLKLDANGNSQWQKALSGGVYCFFNGYSTTCHAIGADVYSVHQSADGGYVLAGSGDLKEPDGAPLVPWLARTDASGNLLWQHFYYQTYPGTGRPISGYFASSDMTTNGYLAVGFTENTTDLKAELLVVRTDGDGLVGGCSQIHPATPLDAIDPGLATIAPGLPVETTTPTQGALPSSAETTAVSTTGGGC